MAVNFIKKGKKQRNLLIIFILMIIIIIIILWQGFLKEKNPYVPEEISFFLLKEVKINFKTFEKIKEFQSFKFIRPITGEKGRENPFLPY
jgi:hypothetical protein